jgi:hypothetical protein
MFYSPPRRARHSVHAQAVNADNVLANVMHVLIIHVNNMHAYAVYVQGMYIFVVFTHFTFSRKTKESVS